LKSKINNRKILLKGNAIYPGIATGHLRIIQSMQDFNKILRGEIIVIPYQDLIKRSIIKAGAIVATDERFNHMSHLTLGPFFSGKPTIITTPETTKMLRNGAVVTVNGKSGELHLG
jgi:pyruvate,water dikinase